MQVPINLISSPLNYTGGKFKLLPQILPLFPDNIDTFYDIFCGGCNVALNVNAKKIICNDNEKKLIGLFSFFKKQNYNNLSKKIFELIEEFNLSNSSEKSYSFYNCESSSGLGKYNRSGFLKLRAEHNLMSETDENYFIILYVLIVYCFNNQIRFNSEGKFNLPVGKRDFNKKMQEKLKSFLENINKLTFQNKDFSKIDFTKMTENDFIYADPPYLITCATYNERNWSEENEKKLLDYLDCANSRNIKFALSNVLETDGKANVILKKWLEKNQNYHCHNLDFTYKNSNYQKKNGSIKANEVLITNY